MRGIHSIPGAGHGLRIWRAALSAALLICAVTVQMGYVSKTVFCCVAFLLAGADVMVAAVRHTLAGRLFDTNLLIVFASLCAIIITKYEEAAAVVIIFQAGEIIHEAAENKSKREITRLLRLRPEYAKIIRDGVVATVPAADVEVGCPLLVKAGETIPLDAVVRGGSSSIDLSPLTGKSEKRHVEAGDEVTAGCINLGQDLTLEVTHTYADSIIERIVAMEVNAARSQSKAEENVIRFSKLYTPFILILALAMVALPLLVSDMLFIDSLYRALVLIIIACPSAMLVAVPTSYFAAIGAALRSGILLRDCNVLDSLSNTVTAVFDKTGTITEGRFTVKSVHPVKGLSSHNLLALAAYAESGLTHPVARAIIEASGSETRLQSNDRRQEIAGCGIKVSMKGAMVYIGNLRLMKDLNIPVEFTDENEVYIAINSKYAGRISILEYPKYNAGRAISELRTLGVNKTVLLTCDKQAEAERIARAVGIDEYMAELLPDEKAVEIDRLKIHMPEDSTLTFTGNGKREQFVMESADVGVAIGALGYGVVSSAADAVILDDDIEKLPLLIKLGRQARRNALINFTVATVLKVAFIVLAAFGIAQMWHAVLADIMALLIILLNSARFILAGD